MSLCVHAVQGEGQSSRRDDGDQVRGYEPEDGKPKKAEAPKPKPQSEKTPAHDTPEALSDLPHAKLVPKKRGRK